MIDTKEKNSKKTAQSVNDDKPRAKHIAFETLSPSLTNTNQHDSNLNITPAVDASCSNDKKHDINLVLDVPVNMTVELGRTKMTIKELLGLNQGSIVALEGLAGEALDILINGYLIAKGEVVVVGDNYGVRVTDIVTPSERMHRLGR